MAGEEQSSQVFDNLLFPKIFQTFRIAIHPGNLIIAFSAVAVICLVGWIMDFSNTVVAADNGDTELQIFMASPDQLHSFIETNKQTGRRTGVFTTLRYFAAMKFQGAVNSLFKLNPLATVKNIAQYFVALGWAIRYHFVYSIIFFAMALAAISITAGAICRISALQFARGEKPGLTEALRFSTKKFLSFFAAPLSPAIVIIFFSLFILALGLIGNIPGAGELIMGILMLAALIIGALIALVAIGTVAGFNLMFPAVAYDGSDCFDAISRSFSYVFAKPWRMGFYTAVAAVYGAICYTFVRFFAFLLLLAPYLILRLAVWANGSSEQADKLAAIWPKPSFGNLSASADLVSAGWSESTAAFLVHLSTLFVIGLIAAFIISFYFSANTIIYSLMRNRVDNTAMEDVYIDLEDVEAEPTSTAEETAPQPGAQTQDD